MRLNIEIPCFKFDSIDLNSRNICPLPIDELEGFEYCHYKNLEKIVDDGELDHISCKNVINFINYKELEQTLIGWFKKLRHGGTMLLLFEDLIELCRLVTVGKIKEEMAQELIYGKQFNDIIIKKSGTTIAEIKRIFVQNGMFIETIKIEGFYCCITSRRI